MVGRADLLDTRENIPNRWGIKKRIFNLAPLTFNPNRYVSKNSEQSFHFVGELRDRLVIIVVVGWCYETDFYFYFYF